MVEQLVITRPRVEERLSQLLAEEAQLAAALEETTAKLNANQGAQREWRSVLDAMDSQ